MYFESEVRPARIGKMHEPCACGGSGRAAGAEGGGLRFVERSRGVGGPTRRMPESQGIHRAPRQPPAPGIDIFPPWFEDLFGFSEEEMWKHAGRSTTGEEGDLVGWTWFPDDPGRDPFDPGDFDPGNCGGLIVHLTDGCSGVVCGTNIYGQCTCGGMCPEAAVSGVGCDQYTRTGNFSYHTWNGAQGTECTDSI